MQRIFIGRDEPALPLAAQILCARYAADSTWDMRGVLVALPGSQAARRLRRLLHDAADAAGLALIEPKILTNAALLDRLYPPRKTADTLSSNFAWIQAAARLSEADRMALAPKAEASNGTMEWAGIAHEAQRAREAATAERMTLAEDCGEVRRTAGCL